MAKKKAANMTATEIEKEVKFVRLALPADVHAQFRIAAAHEQTTMAELARKIVEDYLSKRKGMK